MGLLCIALKALETKSGRFVAVHCFEGFEAIVWNKAVVQGSKIGKEKEKYLPTDWLTDSLAFAFRDRAPRFCHVKTSNVFSDLQFLKKKKNI